MYLHPSAVNLYKNPIPILHFTFAALLHSSNFPLAQPFSLRPVALYAGGGPGW